MKVHRNERGSMDLEVQIERLQLRVRELEDINDGHRKLNGELRKEIQYYKEKSYEGEKHKNLLQGYKTVINDLTSQLRKAGK
jgi:predicted RNase H-like nuclease (RuvC/YqgF family)